MTSLGKIEYIEEPFSDSTIPLPTPELHSDIPTELQLCAELYREPSLIGRSTSVYNSLTKWADNLDVVVKIGYASVSRASEQEFLALADAAILRLARKYWVTLSLYHLPAFTGMQKTGMLANIGYGNTFQILCTKPTFHSRTWRVEFRTSAQLTKPTKPVFAESL